MLVAKLKGARERKRATGVKVEGRKRPWIGLYCYDEFCAGGSCGEDAERYALSVVE
jgi:hypothetical protein